MKTMETSCGGDSRWKGRHMSVHPSMKIGSMTGTSRTGRHCLLHKAPNEGEWIDAQRSETVSGMWKPP